MKQNNFYHCPVTTKFKTMLILVLLFLFAAGNALAAAPLTTRSVNTTDATVTDITGWDDDEQVECLSVTGITEAGIDFVVVPGNIPGPGEKNFSLEQFMENILGNGINEKGVQVYGQDDEKDDEKVVVRLWGAKVEIADLKVYKETITPGTNTEEMVFTYALIEGVTLEPYDCSDTDPVLPDEICVEVTGIPNDVTEFLIVPADVKGPEDQGFDKGLFLEMIKGNGGIYEGEIFACYFGTEEQLTNPGMNVYRYEYDNAVLETMTETDDWFDFINITLVPTAVVKKIDCPEPPPEPEEICVEVTGVTGTNVEYVIVPSDIKGPGDQGFDRDRFFNGIIGGGNRFGEDAYAFFFGTREQLTEQRLKVYKYIFDENADLEPMTFDEMIAAVKLALIPDAAVSEIECSEVIFDPEAL